MTQNSDMFWKPKVAIEGDVASFLVSLNKALKGYTCNPEWPAALKARDEEKEQDNR